MFSMFSNILLYIALYVTLSQGQQVSDETYAARLRDCAKCFPDVEDECVDLVKKCQYNKYSDVDDLYDTLVKHEPTGSADTLVCQGVYSLLVKELTRNCRLDLGSYKDLLIAGLSYLVRTGAAKWFPDTSLTCDGWTFFDDDGNQVSRPLQLAPPRPAVRVPQKKGSYYRREQARTKRATQDSVATMILSRKLEPNKPYTVSVTFSSGKRGRKRGLRKAVKKVKRRSGFKKFFRKKVEVKDLKNGSYKLFLTVTFPAEFFDNGHDDI